MTYREPKLRLEMQLLPPLANPEHEGICMDDLRDSVAMAAQFHRMQREGTIRPQVDFADFVAISQVARNWLQPSLLRDAEREVVRDEVRERDSFND